MLDILLPELNQGNFEAFRNYLHAHQVTKLSFSWRLNSYRILMQALQNTPVTRLTLLDVKDPHDMEEFFSNLPQTNVTALHLGINFTITEIIKISHHLTASNITELRLFIPLDDEQLTAHLAKSLNGTSITKIILSHWSKALSVFFGNLAATNITDITVWGGVVRCQESVGITAKLKNTKITHFGFVGKFFTNNEIVAIAKNLRDSNVTHLNLKCCGISNKFVISLIRHLERSRISEIDLSMNDFDEEAIYEIIKILPRTLIRRIILEDNFNRISATAREALNYALSRWQRDFGKTVCLSLHDQALLDPNHFLFHFAVRLPKEIQDSVLEHVEISRANRTNILNAVERRIANLETTQSLMTLYLSLLKAEPANNPQNAARNAFNAIPNNVRAHIFSFIPGITDKQLQECKAPHYSRKRQREDEYQQDGTRKRRRIGDCFIQ